MPSSRALPILSDDVDGRAGRVDDRADGRALAQAQRLLDAGDLAAARVKLAPLAAAPASAVRAHAALLDAGLALMSGQPAEALDILARVPASPPFPLDDGYRAMLAASALRQLRRFDEALAQAERAASLGPSPGRLLVLADAQKHAGALAAAVATLERLLAAEPEHITALAQLAGYLHLAGDAPRARTFAALFEATARATEDNDADVERNRAFIHLAQRDLDPALACLARALALDPVATRAYIADEVELDPWRADARLVALLA